MFTSDKSNTRKRTLEEQAELRAVAMALGHKPRDMFHSIRVAVCGKPVGPLLFEVLEILGRDAALKRLDAALARLERERMGDEASNQTSGDDAQ